MNTKHKYVYNLDKLLIWVLGVEDSKNNNNILVKV